MPGKGLCGFCGAWVCRNDDAWCGYCGEPCAEIRVSVRPDIVHAGELPPRMEVEIVNLSIASLALNSFEIPKWLQVPLKLGMQLPPRAPQRVAGELTRMVWKAEQGNVVAHTAAGTGTGCILWVNPIPRVNCDPHHAELWINSEGKGNSGSIALRPEQGMLRILNVRPTNPTLQVITVLPAEGMLAGPENPLTVEIALQPVPPALQPGSIDAIFEVEYASPHGPQTVHARTEIPVRRQPRLSWTGMYESVTRKQAARQRLSFEFRNQHPDGKDGGLQNGILRIQGVELLAPALAAVAIKLLTGLPLEIGGGDQGEVEFEVNLSSLRGRPEGFERFVLRVDTNLPREEWEVRVRVEPMPIFEGVVAIDFGSSNSCCAVWSPGETPALLPVDEEETTISPTVVRYLSLRKRPVEIEIGDRPKRLAAIDARVAASTADHLKQRLGTSDPQVSIRPEKDEEWVLRGISEAAADYLGMVRELAEAAKGAAFRDFLLTHPARCSLRHILRLRAALLKAFGDTGSRVGFLMEPIAALMGFLLERSKTNGHFPCTIASFDIGGGTTDIALIAVERHDPGGGQVRIRPRILYCQGDSFGGEDLTDFLVREITDRCRNYLAVKAPGCALIAEGVPGSAELEIRRNSAELRRVSELFKVGLSQERQAEKPDRVDLRVLEQGHTRNQDVPFDEIKNQGSRGNNLETRFLSHALEQIGQRARMLRRAVDVTGSSPDIVQLSGKTAYLPVVGKAIRGEFPGAEICLAPDPKACVATGACLLRSQRYGDVVLDLDGGTRMTSTIGAFPLDSPRFQPLLKVDEVIPDFGLEGELPNAWDGYDPVVLWEDVSGTDAPIEYANAGRDLNRLGSWYPDEPRWLPPGHTWSLRVRLRDFTLFVEAVSSNGDRVAFHSFETNGE